MGTPESELDSRHVCLFVLQVEGLYKNYGDLAPLKKLVELKEKYHYRLYLDQTFSFGSFGATGTYYSSHSIQEEQDWEAAVALEDLPGMGTEVGSPATPRS